MEISKRPARKRYSREEKDKALKLIKELGYSVQQAADSIGVHQTTLRGWQQLASEGKPNEIKANISIEEENRRLKEENRQLKLEREILKKATAFFASEKN